MSEKQEKRVRRGKKLPLIVLAGFVGTGKTETGLELAEMLGLDFADTDRLIEDLDEMSIAELLEKCGEKYFREREEKICRKLSKRSGIVIATGGGTLLNENNFLILSQKGQIVLLTASTDAILERVLKGPLRPLLFEDDSQTSEDSRLRERILRILDERDPVYQRFRLRIDTTHLDYREAASRIAPSIDLPSRKIEIRMPVGFMRPVPPVGTAQKTRLPRSTVSIIEIGRGILSKLGKRLESLGISSKAFLLLPDSIENLYFDQAAAALDAASIPWEGISIRDSEEEKTLVQAGEVIDELALKDAGRDSVIVTIGGGATGDLGGFVASVYMQGIPLVHVPTTLLAQVDSSIGGKTGVNHPWAKNTVGSLHPPHLVLTDPCVLRSLPREEISNGMVEVVKTAIIGSPSLFDFIERELNEDPSEKLQDIAFLEECVAECVAIKASIVEKDPFGWNEQMVLNLGHTLGQALEAAEEYYGLTHGEAVSIGLVAAMRISVSRGLVDEAFLQRTKEMLMKCSLPVTAPSYNEKILAENIYLDKKMQSGRFYFVLPVRLGSLMTAKAVTDVTEAEMLAALWKGTK